MVASPERSTAATASEKAASYFLRVSESNVQLSTSTSTAQGGATIRKAGAMQSMDVPRQPKRARLRRARTTTVSSRQSTGGSDVIFGLYLEEATVDAANATARCVGFEGVFVPTKTDAYETFVKRTARRDGRGARS